MTDSPFANLGGLIGFLLMLVALLVLMFSPPSKEIPFSDEEIQYLREKIRTAKPHNLICISNRELKYLTTKERS